MKLKSRYSLPLFLATSLLSLFPLLQDPQQLLFWRGGAFSDLMISHWPNALTVRRGLESWGQLPLWNPAALSGAPLAADPLAGIWYPPNWLAVALPTALGFNLLIWLHLAWAGIGCWALARRLGLSHAAAVIAGLAFAGAPKLLGHVGLGHVSLLYAVSWTPWALLAADSAARAARQPFRRRLSRAAGAGAVTGLVLLADPRWYPGLMLLTAAFFLRRAAHSHTQLADDGEQDQARGNRGVRVLSGPLGRGVALLVAGGAISLAVGSALLLPMAEFVALSTRAGLELSQAAASSLPMGRLLQLLAPDLGVWPEWQVYSGAVVLFLAALASVRSARASRFWLTLVLIGLLFALGDATPFFPLVRAVVPGLSQLRVPPRSLLLGAFGLAMLAGQGFDALQALPRKMIGRVAAALFTAYLLIGAASWIAGAEQTAQHRLIEVVPWIISGMFVGIAGLWSWGGMRRRLSAGAFATFLAAMLVMDLTLVNLTSLKAESVDIDPLAELAAEHTPAGQRVFSPSYSLTQPSSAELGLESADGINPLQLRSYRAYMARAAGFDASGYSVTLPPFPGGAVDAPWGFDPDLDRLGTLAVATLAADYPLDAPGLELLGRGDGVYLYRNPRALPRAWIERANDTDEVQELNWSPNRIELRVEGGGRLVLSEVDYPGWTATVDGVEAAIVPYAGLLRSVELPPGPHVVRFEFRPMSVYAGAAISLLGLLITGSLWIRR